MIWCCFLEDQNLGINALRGVMLQFSQSNDVVRNHIRHSQAHKIKEEIV